MIDRIQKNRIVEKILQTIYKKGRAPSTKELFSLINNAFRFKEFGKPMFRPRAAARGLTVSSSNLKDNIVEIKQDLDIAFEDISSIQIQQLVVSNGFYGEAQNLKQKLVSLNEELDSLLLREANGSLEIFYDNFRDLTKVDLSLTNAFVDTTAGYVSLPISAQSSVRYSSSSTTLVSEIYSEGSIPISGNFLSCLSDFIDEAWTAQLSPNGSYKAVINLTGGDVVLGHSNEVEVNRITIDPLSSMTLTIEQSTDGVNWYPMANGIISNNFSFEFDSVFCLFVRFTISGNKNVGIRRIEIGKVGTSDSATLISKAIKSDNPIYSLKFDADQSVPFGTNIANYIGTSNVGPWLEITNPIINLVEAKYNILTFGSSGSIVTDSPGDSTTLYKSSGSVPTTTVIDSAELWRGVGQFKVQAFYYNWESQGEPNHIPDIADWISPKGEVGQCYMQSGGIGTDITNIPSNLKTGNNTFIMTYSNSQQDYWGAALQSASGYITREQYNYRITTYIYSDRDVLISNSAGGLYAVGASTVANLSSAIGWAFYVNNTRVAGDNRVYTVSSTPGSGNISSTSGKTFPFSLQPGWNKVEVLIYIPKQTALDSNIRNYNLELLFRPNLFNFVLQTSDLWSYAPKLNEYPIWADGAPMKNVSEFYLKWNTSPWDNSSWAWRISSSSGTPTNVLLNYNPINTTTIDGQFIGSNTLFRLKYTYIDTPINTIYFKSELKRNPVSQQPPKLYSYKFMVTK